MQAAHNELITRIGPGTPCGELLRRYSHPVALLEEFESADGDSETPSYPVRLELVVIGVLI